MLQDRSAQQLWLGLLGVLCLPANYIMKSLKFTITEEASNTCSAHMVTPGSLGQPVLSLLGTTPLPLGLSSPYWETLLLEQPAARNKRRTINAFEMQDAKIYTS